MKDYILTIRVPVVGMDDPSGRAVAEEILSKLDLPGESIVKLQRIQDGAPPVKVSIDVERG